MHAVLAPNRCEPRGEQPSDSVTTTVIRVPYVQAVRALDTPPRPVGGVAFRASLPKAGAIWPLTAWRPAKRKQPEL